MEPQGAYAAQPFFTGFLEGYNTMDALASLAFGIVVVQVIQGLGVEKAESVAMTTVRSGILSCLLMGVMLLVDHIRKEREEKAKKQDAADADKE